eukprot:jgi/Mesvir1/5222/Mv15351-RA.1
MAAVCARSVMKSAVVGIPSLPAPRSQLRGSLAPRSLGSKFSVSLGTNRCKLPRCRRQCCNPVRGVRADASAGTDKKAVALDDEVDSRVLPYCDINKENNKKTIGEMEQEFLNALQSFYFNNTPIMSNEEFDNLKEELLWEGSSVVMMSPTEQKFIEAKQAFMAGKPVMTDAEFDALKRELKEQNSSVAIAGPRCSIRSRRVVSDASVDYIKMTLLNLPAAVVTLAAVFVVDDLTDFGITYLVELPEPWSFLFTWGLVIPITYVLSTNVTRFVFQNPLILQGPCPECGSPTVSYFGSILGVAGDEATSEVQCENCKSTLEFSRQQREILLKSGPPPPKPAGGPKGAKGAKGAKKAKAAKEDSDDAPAEESDS